MRRTMSFDAKMNVIKDFLGESWVTFPELHDVMWTRHRISIDNLQRTLLKAEKQGLAEIQRGQRNSSASWRVRLVR